MTELSSESNSKPGSQSNAEPALEPYGKKNPFPAPVLKNECLTGDESPKETVHVELGLEGSGLQYEVGDALAMIPQNDPELVDLLLAKLPFDGTELIEAEGSQPVTLRQKLIDDCDITNLNTAVLKKWAEYTAADSSLRVLLAKDDKQAVADYAWGRDFIDVMKDAPASFDSPAQFVAIFKKMAPRLYSIASSPNAHPGQVHLTVGVVRYNSHGRTHNGVCSSYMSDRMGKGPVKVFVHSNKNFRLPEDKTKPVIMVGPGTGIAPFRAFIEERITSKAPGKNWLFFGNPYRATDFLYEEWLTSLASEGKIKLSLAFSRDQAVKIYVQHLMLQKSKQIWEWLQEGAYFYVCGDAERMAKDVDNTLRTIAQIEGGMTQDQAEEFLKTLKKEKRYQRDVY